MATYIVQRYCARNDTNGNPRRVIVVRDINGDICATEDEGYVNRETAITLALSEVSACAHGGDVIIDIGDVDVRPGIVARLVKWQEGDGQ